MKKFLSSPAVTAAFFVLGIALILFGGVSAILAAPKIQSGDYKAQMTLTHLKTELLENEHEADGDGKLLGGILTEENKSVRFGYAYKEEIKAKNNGDVDEYVRIKVRKFWTDDKGKRVDLDPAMIKLGLGEGWNLDESASTDEEIVLYYNEILKAGEETPACVKTLTINPDVMYKLKSAQDAKDDYLYQGVKFELEASVEAVQTHNGEDAMISAWGRTNKG